MASSSDIAVTPAVKAIQAASGSREAYAHLNDRIAALEAEIAAFSTKLGEVS